MYVIYTHTVRIPGKINTKNVPLASAVMKFQQMLEKQWEARRQSQVAEAKSIT